MWSLWLVLCYCDFILSALWGIRIRGLWKLPDGRDWLWGKLGLVLMGRAMLSKSLIQFSVDGQGCVPSLLLTWDQTMVEVMKIMETSFKRPQARTATRSDPDPAAGHHWPTSLPETPGHSRASLGQSLVGSLLLSPGSWLHTGFCLCPPRVCFPVLCKFWRLCGGVSGDLLQEGLFHTQVCCTQSPCPRGRPLLTLTSAGDTQTLKGRPGSVSVGSPGAYRFCLSPLSVSVRYGGFDSKYNFTPPTILLGLLLCPCTWGVFFWWDPTFSYWWLFSSKL